MNGKLEERLNNTLEEIQEVVFCQGPTSVTEIEQAIGNLHPDDQPAEMWTVSPDVWRIMGYRQVPTSITQHAIIFMALCPDDKTLLDAMRLLRERIRQRARILPVTQTGLGNELWNFTEQTTFEVACCVMTREILELGDHSDTLCAARRMLQPQSALNTEEAIDRLDRVIEVYKHIRYWDCDEKGKVRVMPRPLQVRFNESGELHCETGPALIQYRRLPSRPGADDAQTDEFFALHGVRVEPEIALAKFTISDILEERNATLMRLMMLRYGLDRFVAEVGATPVDDDPRYGKLMRIEANGSYVLQVKDPSTERDYYLFVDERAYGGLAASKAQAASASLWRRPDGDLVFSSYQDYEPSFES